MADKMGLKAVDLFKAIEDGRVKAVWIIGTNPVVSLPDADQARRALAKCRLVVVSDIVEATDTAALADILLLGDEALCRLAGQAATDMAAGRPIHTADLVIALRDVIRDALDLAPMPADVRIPLQGPTRTQGGGAGRGKGEGERGGKSANHACRLPQYACAAKAAPPDGGSERCRSIT